MSLYLNLGAGRVSFPLVEGQEPYGNHLKPLPPEVYQPGWINVDKFLNPGIQAAADLFRFPWPLGAEENSVDAIYAGHILEHVPHQCRVYQNASPQEARKYGELVETFDGFFLFMYECWRLLKPDGLMYVRSPFAFSTPGIVDPTHTRYLVPNTFVYLYGQDNASAAPFDYHLPMRFELTEPPLMRYTSMFSSQIEGMSADQIDKLPHQVLNVVDEFRVTLRAIK